MEYEDPVRDFVKRTQENLRFVQDIAKRHRTEFPDTSDVQVYEVTQLINSMLGLLVMPHERYLRSIPRTPLKELVSRGWPKVTFVGERPADLQTLYDLMRYLRNAIAHFNLRFLSDGNRQLCGIRVWNEYQGRRSCEAQLSLEQLQAISECFVKTILGPLHDEDRQQLQRRVVPQKVQRSLFDNTNVVVLLEWVVRVAVGHWDLLEEGDGILVDDPGSPRDIGERLESILQAVWKDQTVDNERRACELLDVPSLKDYFRRSDPSGFWPTHLNRCLERSTVPAFVPLQSSDNNYTLWLGCRQWDTDTLARALLEFVEPKVMTEQARLTGMQSDGAERSKQERFLSELQDFEQKLRKVVGLNLEPDFSDGVLLTIAPLWEMIPGEGAQHCWEELLAGKHKGSSIAEQLRRRGLVR